MDNYSAPYDLSNYCFKKNIILTSQNIANQNNTREFLMSIIFYFVLQIEQLNLMKANRSIGRIYHNVFQNFIFLNFFRGYKIV